MHYFANFVAADVSGYLPSNFWSRTILQRCQQDVPVRHAAAALGRAHMEYVTAADTTNFNVSEETAEAYTKATKAVRNYIGKNGFRDRAMVLMCSALFYCFELMRSERRGALQHLEGGTKILQAWQVEEGGSSNSATAYREELRSAFIRMELQAAYYDDGRIPNLSVENEHPFESRLQAAPPLPAFRSLHEAQDSLFSLLHSALVYLTRNTTWKFLDPHIVPPHISSQRNYLVHQFEQWNVRMSLLREEFDSNITSATCNGDRHRTILAVFKLHWQTGRLLILHSLKDDMKAFAPSFDDVADEHIQLARDVISTPIHAEPRTGLDRGRSQTGERSFSLHLGIITPIFLLAFKTTHAHTREVAVELLQAAKGRREGFHDAELCADFITELEAHSARVTISTPEVSSSAPPALEWVIDPAMDVHCWEDTVERIDGLEKLWVAAA